MWPAVFLSLLLSLLTAYAGRQHREQSLLIQFSVDYHRDQLSNQWIISDQSLKKSLDQMFRWNDRQVILASLDLVKPFDSLESHSKADEVHVDYLLSCKLTTDETVNYRQYIQNCSLFSIETNKVNGFVVPSFRLLLNVSHNNTIRIQRFESGSRVSYMQLSSVTEEADHLTLRCYLSQKCFIHRLNETEIYRFVPIEANIPVQSRDVVPQSASRAKPTGNTNHHQEHYYTFTAFILLFLICLFTVVIVLFNVCIWTFCAEEMSLNA